MNKYTFMGNGRNKDFYFTFSFFSKGDIVVKINGTSANGYGVFCIPAGSGNNDFPFTGGHIHFATAPKSTDIITIERKLQLNRVIDYQPSVALNPTVLNQDMNYFFELLKDIKNDLQRFQETYAEFTDTEAAQTLLERINAAMEEIDTASEQIENLGDITTIRTAISNLTESISTLSSTVSGYTTTIGNHTTSIGTLDAFKNDVLDYVVASQAPTAENNYTWYRKYKSGWVEIGGQIILTSSNGNTINLPITMADTNYNVQTHILDDAESAYVFEVQIKQRTTSSFNARAIASYNDSQWVDGYSITWLAFGIAA